MTIEHSLITDPNLHEPKGVSTAAINRVYVADGAGSGSWDKLPAQGIDGISSDGTDGQALTSVGDGTLSFRWPMASASIYFVNIGTPHVVTYPSAYTKINPGTTGGGSPVEFSEGVNARITYTGTPDRKALVEAIVNFLQDDATDRDIKVAIYKNGTILSNSELQITCEQNKKKAIYTSIDTACVTNDYFEVFVQNTGAAGDVDVHSLKLTVRGILD